MKKMVLASLFVLLFVFSVGSFSMAAAQDDATGAAVELEMSDGVVLQGTFYASTADVPAPAVLLLHQLGGSQAEWAELITALQAEDYNILAVDQRGAGATGGTSDWEAAQTDGTALMTWLREQPTVDAAKVAVIGASIGGNVALQVCSTDPDCHTVIALSPGLNFMGVTSEDAVSNLDEQAVFIAAAQHDPYGSQDAARTLTRAAGATVTINTRIYSNGDEHATQMFVYPDLIPSIMLWLDTYAG